MNRGTLGAVVLDMTGDQDRFTRAVEATHRSLEQRLDEAMEQVTAATQPRDAYARTDGFLAVTCRHLAAVDEVLLAVVRHRLVDGAVRAKAYVHQARLLEQATVRVKARLYGEVHAAYLTWDEVWDDVRRELLRHNKLERALVDDLVTVLQPAEADALAAAVYQAEIKAPTRAHPYIPHNGYRGHLARRLWSVADRFWDTLEGRVVPPPVGARAKAHRHNSLIAQYLVGQPRLDSRAPLIEHRRGRRPTTPP